MATTEGQVILITGGVRSGKSAFAERIAADWLTQFTVHSSQSPVVYVATSRVQDGEMAARVARHQALRPMTWQTVEEPLNLAGAVARQDTAAFLLVESVDAWVSNQLLDASPVEGDLLDRHAMSRLEGALAGEARDLVHVRRAQGAAAPLVLVTLEAGMGVVPPYPLGRAFRDLLGLVNATLAKEADQVYLLVAGIPVDVKRLREAQSRR